MSFDGIFTHVMITELKDTLLSGRISKIHQPYDNEIVLVIRARGKNQKLLLSAHPSYARIQLTTIAYQNPDNPPNFVMMLRKHLDGAMLENIHQIENDRVVHFTFSKRDELGDLQDLVLIVELMGRHSTIVLVNKTTGKILDAIKHIGLAQNTYRTILPGGTYIEPPKQTQINPFEIKKEQLFHLFSTAETLNGRYLQQHLQGLGRDTADELAYRLTANPKNYMQVWQDFLAELSEKKAVLTTTEKKEFFTALSLTNLNATEQLLPSYSELLDTYFGQKAEKDRVKQQGGELIRKIENELARNKSKLGKREKTLADSENAEDFRRNGELLTTFMSQVSRGTDHVTLENYYDENRPLTIHLNPALTPNQNAQKNFQRYQKLKNAVKLVFKQIAETKAEIAYLESVLAQLELATPLDIEVIKEELISGGYLKKTAKQKRKKMKPSKPERFLATDGTEILVGKNNLQNDQLTLRTAKKTDFWLHVKNIPGSHVIIKSDQPSDETITEAGELAAYYSKYRFSAQVPVDVVQVKFIHKPNGSKPGYVIYENQKTILVTPSEEKVLALKK